MNPIRLLWNFSRPHTLIGSTLSILALFLLASYDQKWHSESLQLIAFSLLSALSCNIYITGLNQWSDVEVDRINKPWLPIAAGVISRKTALIIVLVCGAISLLSTCLFSFGFTALIAAILAIGTAYSLPPLKFKRNHLAAASAIALVRGLLVNVGFYLHFRYELTGLTNVQVAIWPLVGFVSAFSLGIAWFKDIPDTAGDAAFRFGTLALRSGRKFAFYAGLLIVTLAYLVVILSASLDILPNKYYFIFTHFLALSLFLSRAYLLNVDENQSVKQFYMFFWGLFFLEYIIYPLGFYL